MLLTSDQLLLASTTYRFPCRQVCQTLGIGPESERTSPISGKIGYKISHDIACIDHDWFANWPGQESLPGPGLCYTSTLWGQYECETRLCWYPYLTAFVH